MRALVFALLVGCAAVHAPADAGRCQVGGCHFEARAIGVGFVHVPIDAGAP